MIEIAIDSDIKDMYEIYCYYVESSTATFDIDTPSLSEFSKK